jgi:hypothetical protein
MDREYTAQIQRPVKQYGLTIYVPCGNTTFIMHNPKRSRPSLFSDDLLGFRREYRYGAGIADPKYPNLKVTSITNC